VPKISVVIITLNEEANLERCLQSVEGIADEILVLDSHSTDGTVALAKRLGAKVIAQTFLGHREQKAKAIELATYEHVLSLDADEALSPELAESIRRVKNNWLHDGYYLNRLNRLGGQWIRHGGWYPDRKMRLFDRRKYVIAGVNPHDRFDPAAGATTSWLNGDLLHYTNDDLDSRVATINKFSTIAAQAFHEEGKRGNYLRIFVKPAARFVSEYWFQGGWRDGFYGYFIAKTSAQYVWLREVKLKHLGK
jgi:glycosyltransferase involved in cell wall biosynthesis